MKQPTYLQAYCQSPTSHRSNNQKFVKEHAKPTHIEKLFQRNAGINKIKNADIRADRKNRK